LFTNTLNNTPVIFLVGTTHGPITADIMSRHVGDLGNVTSDSAGTININIQDSIIQLYNATQSIANRTVVLHAMRDDGGMGGFSDSTITGYDLLYLISS
jgi:Cu-Zn family superoxide dismutase